MVDLRGVAQFGSAPALGAGCRRFESCHPDARDVIHDGLSCRLPRAAFLLGREWCAQNVRKAVSKGRVLRTTFRALRTTSHQPRHHFLTEPQVAAGAGVSL